ncbi:MAG: hypothetical protein ICV64_12105 [Thermoleophilia bacterium]|nr:hypothetical protein [Thermoleophilia bacterium]
MSTANVVVEERERVEAWRRQELARAGYPAEAAEELAARSDVDLRVAVSLLERGCRPEVALRILR